jgi:hypothetical protein
MALALLAVAGTLALAACGGTDPVGADPEEPGSAEPVVDEGSQDTVDDADPANQFVGLPLDDAAALADEQERLWRIGRRDGEDLAVTADFVPGRVTFTVDDDVVTAATIEEEAEPIPPAEPPESPETAQLLADAIERLVTVDNTFGGGNPFARIEVATVIGADPDWPLEPLALEMIAAAIQPLAAVEFIPDAKAAIDRYFEAERAGGDLVTVVSIDDVRIDGDRAELDMALWCGSLCGTWFTYEAKLGPGGWEILGTTGSVAIS